MDLESLEIMHRNEMDCDKPTAWEAWVKSVESMIGHSLDGDQTIDGYSLDYAYETFRCGTTAREYAAHIKEN